jgi:hypothetical protein
MTTAQDPIPQQEPLFLIPPPPTPTGPQKKKKFAPWHWLVLIGLGLAVAFLVAVGAYTVTTHVFKDAPSAQAQTAATSKPKPHKSKPAGPRYNLAGYRSAITGPEEQAFASALWKLRADIHRPDYAEAASDAPRLIAAANSWLSLLRQTNPPPTYGPAKLAYVQGAMVARKAAQTTVQALQAGDFTLLQRGADQAARARWLHSHASAGGPQGS